MPRVQIHDALRPHRRSKTQLAKRITDALVEKEAAPARSDRHRLQTKVSKESYALGRRNDDRQKAPNIVTSVPLTSFSARNGLYALRRGENLKNMDSGRCSDFWGGNGIAQTEPFRSRRKGKSCDDLKAEITRS